MTPLRQRIAPALLASWLLVSVGCDGSQVESTDPVAPAEAASSEEWTPSEVALLQSLSIAALPATPAQPSNRVADDRAAADLGHRLFFDPLLSGNGQVSCSTCHLPHLLFTDGRATSRGVSDVARNAPTLVGAAHSTWMFWDGRRDSLWAQALAPIETGAEMGSTRVAVVRRVLGEPSLAALYQQAFGVGTPPVATDSLPERAGPFGAANERDAWYRMSAADRRAVDEVFANVGKALAAYERLLKPGTSRFDQYVAGLRTDELPAGTEAMNAEEIQGLRLFVDAGRTLCLRCHNGPLLTNQSFHNVGTAAGDGPLPEFGRFLGIQAVLIDPFNCLGEFSDAEPKDCRELRFLDKTHVAGEMGKFKTPTLRGLLRTGPYMHDGRFSTLSEVIEHYRFPPADAATQEITPLEIDDDESRALVAFLGSLDGGVDADPRWLSPPATAPPRDRP